MGSTNRRTTDSSFSGQHARINEAFDEISDENTKTIKLDVKHPNVEVVKRTATDPDDSVETNAKEAEPYIISDNIDAYGNIFSNGIEVDKTQHIKHDTQSKRKPLNKEDSLWSWIVCAGCFLHYSLFGSIFFTFGMVFIELVDEFESGKGDTAWIISINIALSLLPGPVASLLSRRFGYWVIAITGTFITVTGMLASLAAKNIQTLYITYGFVAGLGHGFIYHTSVVCVILSFDKKKSFATGIANAGIGFGMFIISPAIETCLQKYGWRGTILIEAGLLLNGVVCGLTYRPVQIPRTISQISSSQEKTTKRDNSVSDHKHRLPNTVDCKISQSLHEEERAKFDSVDKTTRGLSLLKQKICSITVLTPLKSLPFVLFLLSTTLMYLAIYMPLLFIPDLAKTKGIDGRQRSWLLAASGIAGTSSRVIFGWLSDRPWVDKFVIQSTAIVLCGLFTGLMPFCSSFSLLLGDVVLFSAFSGFIPALVSVLIAELIGRDKVSEGFALVCWFSGMSNLLGPPIAGWLFDFFGDYEISFWSFGGVFVLSGSILYIVGCLHRRKK